MCVALKEKKLLKGNDLDSKRRMELLIALKGKITIDYDREAAEQNELRSDFARIALYGK
jgi:hypothetical protein